MSVHPSLRSARTAVALNASGITIQRPVSLELGDLMIVVCVDEGGNRSIPVGWSRVRRAVSGTGGGPFVVIDTFRRFATQVDVDVPEAEWFFPISAGGLSVAQNCHILAYQGVPPVTAIEGTSAFTTGNENGDSIPIPGVQTSLSLTTKILIFATNGPDITVPAQTTELTTSEQNNAGNTGPWQLAVADEEGNPGATRTGTMPSSKRRAGVAIVLRSVAEPPPPPTLSSPSSGEVIDPDEDNSLVSVYNHKQGTPSSAYALRRRESGGAYSYWNGQEFVGFGEVWNPVVVMPGQTISALIPAHEWEANKIYEWSMRTRDENDQESAYAQDFTVASGTPPEATLVSPTGVVEDTSKPTLVHSYFSPDSRDQNAREWRVFNSEFDWGSGVVLGTGTETELTQSLPNDTEFTAQVRVRDTFGVWSEWDSDTFTTDYDQPDPPSLLVSPEASNARVRIQVTGEHDGNEFPDARVSMERFENGEWVALRGAVDIPLDEGETATIYDYEIASDQETSYRAVLTAAI